MVNVKHVVIHRGKRLFVLAVWLLTLHATPLLAQDADEESDAVERGVQTGAEEEDVDALVEELEGYRQRPLRLYEIESEELARLPGIPLHLARAILAFVAYNRPTAIRELGVIQGLSREQLATLGAFTTLDRETATGRSGATVRLRASRDVQLRRGYADALFRIQPVLDAAGDSLGLDTIPIGPRYLGGPEAALLRLDAVSPSLSVGITLEKDAGEAIAIRDTAELGLHDLEYVDPRIRRPVEARITSFVSGSLEARFDRVRLILGDYSADVGMGLVFGTGGSFKGADPARGAERHPRGVRMHRSSDETFFLRGAAAEWQARVSSTLTATTMLFVSHRSFDGTVGARLGAEGIERGISTIRTDGLHRTRSEVERSGTFDERLAGARFELHGPTLRAGITGSFSRFSLPILAELPHEFEGREIGLMGVDVAWGAGPLRGFAEVSLGTNGAVSGIAGGSGALGDMALTLALRSFSPSAFPFHGYAFGERPRMPANEQGIYVGFELRPTEKLRLTGYCDLYRVPERTRSTPLPRSGADLLLEAEWRPVPMLPVRLRLHHEDGETMATSDDELGRPARRLVRREQSGARLEWELSPGDPVRLRGRIERRMVAIPSMERRFGGTSASLDLRLRPAAALTLGLRGTIFSVEDAEAAIPQLEAGLPGRSLRASLSGSGRRLLATVRWRPTGWLSVAGSFGETRFSDRATIAEGDLQEIDGVVAGNVGLQVDVGF